MTYIDLLEAIAGKIAALWPERTIYRDFCPADFKRPSSFLWVSPETGYRDASIGLVEWTFEAELELFSATDAYDAESTEALRADQAAVLDAFGLPLTVGDRTVMVHAMADSPGPGAAYVIFTASWIDSRPGYTDPDTAMPPAGTAPLMEDYQLNVSVTSGPDREERDDAD